MKKFIVIFVFISEIIFAQNTPLKSILEIEGFQENPLLGYGIVVGLNGSGDSVRHSQTKEILARIADKFGFYLDESNMKPKNSAIVLVSALIPPMAAVGSRLDVRVSSVFDAKNLAGGELIITPLIGGDGKVYAIAQGRLDTPEHFKGVSASIPRGAILQKEVGHKITNTGVINLIPKTSLELSDIAKIRKAIENRFPGSIQSDSFNRLSVKIPKNTDLYDFLAKLLNINVNIDTPASVTIDSRTGMVVAGGNIIISEAAISFKGTRMSINNAWDTESTENKSVHKLNASTTVSDLVEGLNSLGTTPSDIAKILEMLHRNGNLKARLIIR